MSTAEDSGASDSMADAGKRKRFIEIPPRDEIGPVRGSFFFGEGGGCRDLADRY
jgi:hypothetical protein